VDHAVLDVRVRAAADLMAAAGVAARWSPGADVEHVHWRAGVARLGVSGAVAGPPALSEGPPTGDGLNLLRLTRWCPAEEAALLDAALAAGTVPIVVRAEAEVLAAPHRVELSVRFAPAELLRGWRATALPWDDLRAAFAAELVRRQAGEAEVLPLVIEGDVAGSDPGAFGAAMAARLRSHHGAFAADPTDRGIAHLRIVAAAADEPPVQRWDLATIAAAPLPVVLELDDAGLVEAHLREHGTDALRRTVTVPPLVTGFHALDVTANLPADRGDAVFGVRVRKAATPLRPAPIDETVVLRPPADRASLVVRLSPVEDLQVHVSTLVHLPVGSGARWERAERPWSDHGGPTVVVPHDAFPATFAPLVATPALLAEGDLRGEVVWRRSCADDRTAFRLDAAHPRRVVVLPDDAEVTGVVLRATAPDGRSCEAEASPVPEGALDRELFPGYGPTSVEVRCRFEGTRTFLAVELALPGGGGPGAERLSMVTFRPEQPARELRWFNPSIFPSGYRYRIVDLSGGPTPWSDVHFPGAPLELVA
jgi:hypothetical protein